MALLPNLSSDRLPKGSRWFVGLLILVGCIVWIGATTVPRTAEYTNAEPPDVERPTIAALSEVDPPSRSDSSSNLAFPATGFAAGATPTSTATRAVDPTATQGTTTTAQRSARNLKTTPTTVRRTTKQTKESSATALTATPRPPDRPALAALPAMLPPPADAQAWNPKEPYRYVEVTGHNLGLAIKTFYDTNGGETIFGHPLTEVLVDTTTGLQVQYFERARIEIDPQRPGPDQIGLTRSGALLVEGRIGTAFRPARHPPTNDPAFFPQTGYRVSGKFYTFWQDHGGVPIFGYPISGELIEAVDGQRRLVQYFERARLEYDPQHAGTAKMIQVGQLGKQLVKQHAVDKAFLARAEPIVKLSSATTTFGDSDGTRNAALAAQHLNGHVVEPGQMLSFLEAIGELTTSAGYSNGSAIVGDQIVPIVAGGVCQTSTTLYRALFNAGLPITERHPHSLYIQAFNDVVSFDAAVFSPGLDLRAVNDTPFPILVTATGENGRITVELWGQNDGRTTQMVDPQVRAELTPEPARWQYDPELAPDATEQAVSPRNGMEVVLGRIVTAADGTLLRRDTFVTRYRPVAAEIRFGAEVTPPEGVQIEGELPPTPSPTPAPTETEAAPTEPVPTEAVPDEPTPAEIVPTEPAEPTPAPTEAAPAEATEPTPTPTSKPIGVGRPDG